MAQFGSDDHTKELVLGSAKLQGCINEEQNTKTVI